MYQRRRVQVKLHLTRVVEWCDVFFKLRSERLSLFGLLHALLNRVSLFSGLDALSSLSNL